MGYAIALYGAGRKSLGADLRLRRHFPDCDVRWLVENRDFSKLGQPVARLWMDEKVGPLKVISLAGLRQLHEAGICQQILIPGNYHLFDLREARRLSAEAGFAPENIRIMPHNCLAAPLDTEWNPEDVSAAFDEHPYICSLDVHVVDHCNLKCKVCSHFSSLVENDVIYAVDKIAASLEKLSLLVPNVANLWLLGGEPLLHPRLFEIVKNTRQSFPYANIAVITNGLLLQSISVELISALRESNVSVGVSLYPPLRNKIDDMVDWLQRQGLRWHINRCDAFEKRLFTKPISPRSKGFAKCGHNMCLRGSRLGYCVMALYTDYFNARFGTMLPEDNGVDIWPVNSGHELMAALERPLDLCAYCVSRDAGSRYFEPWQLAGPNTTKPSDWFIDGDGNANPIT